MDYFQSRIESPSRSEELCELIIIVSRCSLSIIEADES